MGLKEGDCSHYSLLALFDFFNFDRNEKSYFNEPSHLTQIFPIALECCLPLSWPWKKLGWAMALGGSLTVEWGDIGSSELGAFRAEKFSWIV